MKNNEMKELNALQLDEVSGGTRMQEHALRTLFLGGNIWDDSPVSLEDKFWAHAMVIARTGYTPVQGELNSEGEYELVYRAPDGTIMAHDDFMDYLRANYTVEYLSGGKCKE